MPPRSTSHAFRATVGCLGAGAIHGRRVYGYAFGGIHTRPEQSGAHSSWVRTRRSTLRPVSSSSPLSTGRAAWTASGAAPEVMLRAYHGASVAISVACTDVQPCLIPLHQPPLADCEGTAGACAGYCVRHGPLSSVLPQARGLRRQSSSWCTWLYWVGTGRVALWYVSPCPPLDPYVRLSPHTAHDRGTFTGHFPFANSTDHSPWSACAFVGYLCTVSPPSPSGPSPSVLILVSPAFLGSDS